MKKLLLFVSLALATGALAAEGRKFTVGVFLPTSLAQGQERFAFSEALAAKLGQALGRPAVGKNFGRYEDFAKAIKDDQIDLAVMDAWAAAQGPANLRPVALGVLGGQTQRKWAIVARSKGSMKSLIGKRLAISRGVEKLDPKFLNNAIFVGDFDASRDLKLVSAPSVDSSLTMLESRGAEAALVPAALAPANLPVVYQSPKLPIAVAMVVKGNVTDVQAALLKLGEVAPFEGFAEAKPTELDGLRSLIAKGPAKQQPLMAESPIVRPDAPALLNFREVGLVLPNFLESYEVSKEQPDD